MSFSAFALGCGTFALYPICISHVNDKIADNERVRVSGLLILLQSVGMIFGPILISALIEIWGSICFVLAYSVFGGGFVIFVFHFITFRPNVHYLKITPTHPMPAALTHVFHEVTKKVSLVDKAKYLLQNKKH